MEQAEGWLLRNSDRSQTISEPVLVTNTGPSVCLSHLIPGQTIQIFGDLRWLEENTSISPVHDALLHFSKVCLIQGLQSIRESHFKLSVHPLHTGTGTCTHACTRASVCACTHTQMAHVHPHLCLPNDTLRWSGILGTECGRIPSSPYTCVCNGHSSFCQTLWLDYERLSLDGESQQ